MTTASDVIGMLRRHYLPEGRPPGGVFAPEIEAPNGRRRADLIWLPTTIAGGRGLVGHEVKVTRPDVLTELNDPTKADPWAQYCTRWWLVVAEPELVDGLAIPDAWGIMAPPSGRRTRSMTILRPAPLLEPADPGPGLQRLASWMLYRHHDTERQLRAELDYRERTIAAREAEIGRLRAEGLRMVHPHAARIGAILAAIDAGTHAEGIWSRIDDDAVIRAILDTAHVRQAARDAVDAVRRIEAALTEDPLRFAREHLAKVRAATDPVLAAVGVRRG